MRAPKTIASRSSLRRSAKPPAPPPISKHAEELMELAVEAAQSRHLPDFLEQFALRATRMLDAIWGGVAVFVRIAGSDNERLGTLCLIRKRKGLDGEEKRLLHALASHAALSLENFRRFSQLERSKRQWVEDIDAISDYIVVHD